MDAFAPTLIATIVSSIVAYFVASRTNRYSEISRIDEQILKLNILAVEYPYLEDDDFCAGWNDRPKSPHQDEKYMRYDNYCCIVFNLIENLWDHYNGNKKKIEDYFYVKEVALRHRQWWISEAQNEEGYRKIHGFINGYLG